MASIQGIYVALFGRPADPNGLAYFDGITNHGADLAAIGNLAGQPEYLDRFTGMSNEEIINSIYVSLFNRNAEATGISYFAGRLKDGSLNSSNIAIAILDAARGSDLQTVTAKIAFADAFTAKLDTPAEIAAYVGNTAAAEVRNYLATVDASNPGSPDRLEAILGHLTNAQPPSGPSAPTALDVHLTSGADHITGTTLDDRISGFVDGTDPSATTYDPATDMIDGGAGHDTLAITMTDAGIIFDPTKIANIETVAVTLLSGSPAVDLRGVQGVTEIVNDASTSTSLIELLVDHPGMTLTIRDTSLTTNFETADLSGTDRHLTLALDNAGTVGTPVNVNLYEDANHNRYESLSIMSHGAANFVLLSGTYGYGPLNLATIAITGSGNLNLEMGASSAGIGTIDAATATGSIVLGSQGAPLFIAEHHITLGSGNDTVFLGYGLSGDDVINGGDGIDTLAVSQTVSNADMAQVSGVEVLRFHYAVSITQDASLTSLAGYDYALGDTSSASLTGLANGTSIEMVDSVRSVALALASSSGNDDSLTLKMSAAGALVGTLQDIVGLETLNIVTEAATSSSSTLSALAYDNVTARHVISGSGMLSIRTTHGGSFDASAMTGDFNLSGDFSAAVNVKGSSGVDTITLGAYADTVDTGSGNDFILLSERGYANRPSGGDIITTGEGNDRIYFFSSDANGTGAAADYSNFARITDFHVGTPETGQDVLVLSSGTVYSLTSANGTGTRQDYLSQGNNDVISIGSGIVVQELGHDAAPAAMTPNVSVFKLTNQVAFTTDVKGTFAAAMGSSSVTGLQANGNYVVSLYDATHHQAVIALVNVGGNSDGDTSFTRDDLVDHDIAVLGVLDMTAADYANLGLFSLDT